MAVGNTRVKLLVGLLNTYNVFSLSENANNILKIEIIKDTDKEIKNVMAVPDEQHYNTGPYPTSAGSDKYLLEPLCQDPQEEFKLTDYGPILYKKIMEALGYEDVDTSEITSAELWTVRGDDEHDPIESGYDNYKNQFKIMWPEELQDRQSSQLEEDDGEGDEEETLQECWDTIYQYDLDMYNREYISYDGTIKKFGNRRYYTGTYEEMNSFQLNIDIVHFSKYYPVYSHTNVDLKVLTPIIYTSDDLSKYNLGMYTEDDGNYHVHINTFMGFNNACGTNGTEERSHIFVSHYTDGRYYKPENSILLEKYEGRAPSVFKNNSGNKKYIVEDPNKLEVFQSYMYSGFYLYSMYANGYLQDGGHTIADTSNNTIVNKNNSRNWEPNIINPFNPDITRYYRQYPPARDNNNSTNLIGGTRDNYSNKTVGSRFFPWATISENDSAHKPDNTPLVGVAFYGDNKNEIHFLNTYFTVEPSLLSYNSFTQKIALASGNSDKISSYVGDMIVSALGNIYVDKGQTENNPDATIMSDIVYSAPNYTTFTKDMVVRVLSRYSGRDEINLTRLKNALLINGMSYLAFVSDILNNANLGNDRSKISMNNVDVEYNECVKNCPLLYRVSYMNPDFNMLNIYNSGSTIKLKLLDGTTKIIDGSYINPNTLYLYNESTETLTLLGDSYRFRYIKLFDPNEWNTKGVLKAVYVSDNSVSEAVEGTSVLNKFLKYENDLLICKNTDSGSPANLYSYTFCSYNNADDSQTIYDFRKDEVLLNIGKLIK